MAAGNLNIASMCKGKDNKSIKYDKALDPTNSKNYSAQYRIILGEEPAYVSLKSGDAQ